ncbi:hypothetical protein EJB05_53365, partial [Eragrostis curvula]
MPPPSNLSKPPRPAAEAIDSAPSRRNGAAGLGGRARQRWRRGRPLSAITTVTLIQAASSNGVQVEEELTEKRRKDTEAESDEKSIQVDEDLAAKRKRDA